MKLEVAASADPRDVLRALRQAVLGAGPAVALGASPGPPGAAPDPPGAALTSQDTTSGAHGAAVAEPGHAPARLPAEVPAGTAVVLTTSGSSGYPKRVVLSRAALTSSALATADRIGTGAWLLALPATYVAGVQVLVRALVAGREPSILSGSFSAQAFAAAAAGMASSRGGHRIPSYTSLVPAQLQTLLEAEDAGLHTGLDAFEAILVGGQSLPPVLAERAAAAGARIVRTYGSTETSGGCVYGGRPLNGVGLRVEDGEVQVSGPTLADGYLGDPQRTADTFVHGADGTRWYRTGDTGEIADGVLRVTGRRDNVIISGGVNVSLDRVEHVVRGLPGLAGAVVVPVADARWGQASVVVVPGGSAPGDERDPSGVAGLAEVRAAVEARLGAPARPRDLVHIDRLPLLTSGKPDRVALRRLLDG
ncbi:AMP-binding protein [Microbacterium sp. MC2]